MTKQNIFDGIDIKTLREIASEIEINLNNVSYLIQNEPEILSSLFALQDKLVGECKINKDSLLVNCVKYMASKTWKEMLDREIFERENA
jgi:hypothetical protein